MGNLLLRVVTMVRDYVAAAAVYMLLTPLMTWQISDLPHIGRSSFGGDALLNTWAIAWNHHALASDPTAYYHANIFFPYPGALALSEHLFTIGLLTLPLSWFDADALLVYDLAWLASFPCSALAGFLLASHLTEHFWPRLVAGLVYAFNWFRVEHALHIQLLWAFGLPVSVFLLLRWRQRPSTARILAWAAAVTLQCLVSWYLAVLCLIANATVVAWFAAAHIHQHRRVRSDLVWQMGAACLFIGGILAAFAQPYFGFQPASLNELRANSAFVTSYVTPPSGSVTGELVKKAGFVPPVWSFERSVYVGMAPLLLAVMGLASVRRISGNARVLVAVGAIWAGLALLLSLGPRDGLLGLLSPYELLSKLPGVGAFRVPARFAQLMTLGVALLAAAGVMSLRQARAGRWLVAGAAVAVLVEAFPMFYEPGRPRRVDVPVVYRLIEGLPPGPVLALPSFVDPPANWLEADYLYFSTRHWKPIVNGYSRVAPEGHVERMKRLATFPSAPAVAELQALGVSYVVLHGGRYGVDLSTAARAAGQHPSLALVAKVGQDSVWEVRR